MRGWITARHGTCAVQLPLDDAEEFLGGTIDGVVHDHVIELAFLVELPLRALQPLLDLAARFGRPCTQAALQLCERRCAHEDGDAVGNPALYGERAVRLEIQKRCLAFHSDPRDLRPQRSDPLSPLEVHVLEELICGEHPPELRIADEVVLAAFFLALAPLPRRCRYGELEFGDPRHDRGLECSLPSTGRA